MKRILMSGMFLLSMSVMASDVTKPTIMIKQGQKSFTVTLETNATTGYNMFLGKHCHAIVPVSEKYIPTMDSHRIGAPGRTVWKFSLSPKAFIVPRVMRLNFIYMRPWDHKTAVKKTFWVVASS